MLFYCVLGHELLLKMLQSVNVFCGFSLLLENFGYVRVDWEKHCHDDVSHYAENELAEDVDVVPNVVNCFDYESTDDAVQEIFNIFE